MCCICSRLPCILSIRGGSRRLWRSNNNSQGHSICCLSSYITRQPIPSLSSTTMSSPVYYAIDGSPYRAAAIPLPPSPYGSPRGSPSGSPYGIHLVPLPPSPNSHYAALPIAHAAPPYITPLPAPPSAIPTLASLALGTHFSPHPLLEFDPENPKLAWDVRLPPETIRASNNPIRGHQWHKLTSRTLQQQALSPPWTFMRLKCELLPWVVEVSNPSGVTVQDVLEAVYECLREPIEREDWREASVDWRGRLKEVWKRRCMMAGEMLDGGRVARMEEEKMGVRRVDWLLWDFEWLGIRKSSTELETWEMGFRSR